MRIDTSDTKYHESSSAVSELKRDELRHCRQLLRRLRFLEFQYKRRRPDDSSSAASFTEWEMLALEWVLTDVGFLAPVSEVSRNTNTREARP